MISTQELCGRLDTFLSELQVDATAPNAITHEERTLIGEIQNHIDEVFQCIDPYWHAQLAALLVLGPCRMFLPHKEMSSCVTLMRALRRRIAK